MSMRRTALAAALVAAIVSGTGRAQSQASLELGDLWAVPSRGSALVFQLPIVWQAHAPHDRPTVVVRHPSNVLFFVANNTLELRRYLHAQLRTAWRRTSLAPVGLRCGLVAVVHKMVWTDPVAHAHDPQAQVLQPTGRSAYAQLRVVRTA